MFYELVRTIIQKILHDKILMGLVVVGVLAFFVGGFNTADDHVTGTPETKPADHNLQNAPKPAVDPAQAVAPNLATDFVTWWISKSMDYNGATAAQSHQQAFGYMTPDAIQSFQATLWNPTVAESVATGRLVANFQPSAVQAQAVNPDGSVVVGVMGALVVHQNGQPMSQQFLADFLVKKDADGLRIAGLYNKSPQPLPGASIY